MKFGHLFEFHKIPDWYTEYVHYNELKEKIAEFKELRKSGSVKKLKGYYMINRHGQLYCIDFIKAQADHLRLRQLLKSENMTHQPFYRSLSEMGRSSNENQ